MENKGFNIDLSKIKDPKFLDGLSYDELDLLCSEIRKYMLDVVSKNGGHLSSNLGAVESTIALCRCFDFSKDKIIFDVGHQSYTYKILTGRDFDHIRKKDGPSGFPKRTESIYDCYECGHSSTSISAAMGIAAARDLKKEDYKVIAYIGDASFENGLVFEALNNVSKSHSKIIIVLNDNEMSIGKSSGGLSKLFRSVSSSKTYLKTKNATKRVMNVTKFGQWLLKCLSSFKAFIKRHLIASNIFDLLDIKYIGEVDGHNIKKMEKAFQKARHIDGPVAIHIKTIKGKGVKYAENDTSGVYHGVGKFDKLTGKIVESENTISWSKLVSSHLYDEMSSNENTICVCPATSLGSGLNKIKEDFPKRFYDVEINEEHGVVFSAGLASSGIHPFISMYSTFLQRTYDQISHDLARMNLNSTLLIDRAGLVGEDGDTHQGIYDSSFLYTIPNVTITMPSKPSQIKSLISESTKNHGVFAIRYPKDSYEKSLIESDEIIKYGEWQKINDNRKTAIVTYGPIVNELEKPIAEKEIKATIFNAIYTRPILDKNVEALMDYHKIIIYDVYSTEVGFANTLMAKLLANGYRKEIIVKTIPNQFVSHGTIEEQRNELGISIDKIIDILEK